MVSLKVAILIGGLVTVAFLAVGGKDLLPGAKSNFLNFKQELGTGITERTKNIRGKMNGGKQSG